MPKNGRLHFLNYYPRRLLYYYLTWTTWRSKRYCFTTLLLYYFTTLLLYYFSDLDDVAEQAALEPRCGLRLVSHAHAGRCDGARAEK